MSTADDARAHHDAGYRIVSRRHRMASRCPPGVDPGEALRAAGGNHHLRGEDAADQFRRCHSADQIIVSDAVMRHMLRLEGRGKHPRN